ncbi:hypothetical protein MFLAVUS_009097 [Mucor flavus]|uniref:Uncharacterized protein n=1 Tax=Mucor flavus TaxID=439312 RepID=A0ABP9Z8Y5_9FUNG
MTTRGHIPNLTIRSEMNLHIYMFLLDYKRYIASFMTRPKHKKNFHNTETKNDFQNDFMEGVKVYQVYRICYLSTDEKSDSQSKRRFSNTNTNNQASTEGAIGDSDTTNNRVINVSETISSDTTDSRTNDDTTVNQETTNAVDTHDNDNTISPFDLIPCIGSSDDVGDDPWLFCSKNITRLFEDYQSIVKSLVNKHEALSPESYINELAALTNILVLNKHQRSPIAKKVFSDKLLNDLAESMISESMNYNLSLSEQQYMAMAKIINQLKVHLD